MPYGIHREERDRSGRARDLIRPVFARLRSEGFVARMRFACCQSCAVEALSRNATDGQPVVYYHAQDAEDLVTEGGCWLAFGAFNGDDNATVEVGDRIVQACREGGLHVEWARDASQRIWVQDPDCVEKKETA